MPNNLTSGAIVGIATGAFVFATVAMYAGKKIYKTQFNKDDNIVVNNNNNNLQEEAAQRQAEAAQRQAEAEAKAAQRQAELEREKEAAQRQAEAEAEAEAKSAQRQAEALERQKAEAKAEAATIPINAAVEADMKAREERTIFRLNNDFIQKKERDNPEMIELPFKLLGLTSSATIEDVSKEYRKMALKYHTDKSADSGIIFKAIQDALTIINFKRKKKNLVNITPINNIMYDDINRAIQYIEFKNEKEDEKPLVELNNQNTIISNSSNNLTDDIDGGKSRKYRQSNQIKRKRKRKTKKYNKINKYNLTK